MDAKKAKINKKSDLLDSILNTANIEPLFQSLHFLPHHFFTGVMWILCD